MSRFKHSKSSTFLMELLFNLFLFCLLCSCGLLFFSKSHNMTKDTTALHQAVSLVSSVASVYESGDGSLDTLTNLYPCEKVSSTSVTLYLDDNFDFCFGPDCSYYLTADAYYDGYKTRALEIAFRKKSTELIYELTTYYHTQTTVGELKEAQHDN